MTSFFIRQYLQKFLYKSIPNIVSILGVLPLTILFFKDGFQYLIPLIIYNNIMDDLDGILAVKLNLKSEFGAALDNVCDAVAHIIVVMAVSIHYGVTSSVVGIIAVAAILLRVTSRLTPSLKISGGSPTNELMRHILLVLLAAEYFEFTPVPALVAVMLLNSISMLSSSPMPYLIRSLAKSATAIGMVNIALLMAWLFPDTRLVIAFFFLTTHLYSLIAGITQCVKKSE
jgi:phosphatidylserine synthase